MNTLLLSIGCYTDSPSESQGLYQVELDTLTGALSKPELIFPCRNPSFVVSTSSGYYTASEVEQSDSPQVIYIAKSVSDNDISSAPIKGAHPCHIAVDANRKYLISSQYSSGSFDIFALNINGSLDKRVTTIAPAGNGPHPNRQKQSHAHQCQFLATLPQFVTVDLGSDQISFYSYDEEQSDFLEKPTQIVQTPAGSGPRHLVFNQSETHAYVVCELSETILVLEQILGRWQIVQEIEALPNEEKGEATAAIKLSPDERFLYVSCRHQSKISCFAVSQETKQLTFQSSHSTEGLFPRDFLITNDGHWVVAANQHSNNITTFKRNLNTGALDYTGNSTRLDAPVCIAD
ncbi:lactonase family protein [Vibrio sp. T187]|uniref:lactonase family protein n=1 Tax=Vibrio TaxID=662 RepID=UPI0010C944E4|nr:MULTISPECIES: lactonase family protein [Vibrio]MBW3698051.1 lactonase family protein [Vibrio sp. T187]